MFLLIASTAQAGLVGWWRFNGDGTDAISGNNCTLNGSPTFTTGRVGQAITLASASSQYCNLGNPAALQITGALSVSAWINPTSLALGGILDRGGAGASKVFYFYMLSSSGDIHFDVANDCATEIGSSATAVPTISSGVWSHLVAVYVPSTSLTVYTNATQGAQATTSIPASLSPNATCAQNVYIGGRNNASQLINATLDDVRVYNHALSVGEIEGIYRRGRMARR